MKKDIHPKYFEASVKCACGNKFKVGSTKEELNIEICSSCHPFYTGQDKVLDTAGRVEKFKAKRAAASGKVKTQKAKVPKPNNDVTEDLGKTTSKKSKA